MADPKDPQPPQDDLLQPISGGSSAKPVTPPAPAKPKAKSKKKPKKKPLPKTFADLPPPKAPEVEPKNNVVQLVPKKPQNPGTIFGVDPDDIQNLDIEALRENMAKGMYMLESALYTQSGAEYERVAELRKVVKTMEADLLDPKKFAALDIQSKVRMYSIIQQNMNNSLGFLSNLHGTMAHGIEALSHIEKLKSQRGQAQAPGQEDKDKVKQVKALIMEKLKEKINESS